MCWMITRHYSDGGIRADLYEFANFKELVSVRYNDGGQIVKLGRNHYAVVFDDGRYTDIKKVSVVK